MLSALLGMSCLPLSVPTVLNAQESDATLIASYDFEGDVEDNSGNNYHGNAVGEVQYIEDLKAGNKVLHIQNPDSNAEGGAAPLQYVNLGNKIKFNADDYALSFWWKDDRSKSIAGDSGGTIIGNKDYNSGGNKGFAIGSFTSNIRVNFNADSARMEHRVTSFEDEKWHHIVVNYDRDGNMTTYIDGSKNQVTNIASQKGKTIDVNGSSLVLGADGFFKNGVSGGYYDELKVYHGLLNETEINALYDVYAQSQVEAEKQALIKELEALFVTCDQALANTVYNKEDKSVFEAVYKPIRTAVFTNWSVEQLNGAIASIQEAKQVLDAKYTFRTTLQEAKTLLAKQPDHALAGSMKKAIATAEAFVISGATKASLNNANYQLRKEIMRFERQDKRLLSFAVLSDTHVGSGNDTNSNYVLDAMNDLKKEEPLTDTILIAGDYTQDGTKAQYANFQKLMEENWLTMGNRLVLTQGNHDVRWLCGNNPEGGKDPNASSSYCGLEDNFMTRYLPFKNKWLDNEEDSVTKEKTYYATTIQGFQFISLNTEKDLKDYAYLSDEQLTWFENTLEKNTDPEQPIFVTLHQPLNDTHARSTYWTVGNQDAKLKAILKKYPQVVLISGHIHNGVGVASAVNNGYATMLDAPSLAQNENGLNQQQIGYIVNVYDGYTQVRIYDFKNNKYRDEFEMIIDDTLETYQDDSDDLAQDMITYTTNVDGVDQNGIENAFDDNGNTYYRSNQTNQTSVTMTLKEMSIVDGVRYLPLQNYKVNGSTINGRAYQMQGFIENYKIELSSDNGQTYKEVANGTWLSNNNWKRVSFAAQKATNIRVTSLGSPSYNNNTFITIARLEVTGDTFAFNDYNALLNDANAKGSEQFTTSSFASMKAVLQLAKDAIAQNEVNKSVLQKAYESLQATLLQLQKKASSEQVRTMQEMLQHFTGLQKEDYTDTSFKEAQLVFETIKSNLLNKDDLSEDVAMQLYLQGVIKLQGLQRVEKEEGTSPDSKPEVKPEVKPELKPDTKPVVKPEVTPTPSLPKNDGTTVAPTIKKETTYVVNRELVNEYVEKKTKTNDTDSKEKSETNTTEESVEKEKTPLSQASKASDEVSSDALVWTGIIVVIAIACVGGLALLKRKH